MDYVSLFIPQPDRDHNDGIIEVNDSLYAVEGDKGWYVHQQSPDKSYGPMRKQDAITKLEQLSKLVKKA